MILFLTCHRKGTEVLPAIHQVSLAKRIPLIRDNRKCHKRGKANEMTVGIVSPLPINAILEHVDAIKKKYRKKIASELNPRYVS